MSKDLTKEEIAKRLEEIWKQQTPSPKRVMRLWVREPGLELFHEMMAKEAENFLTKPGPGVMEQLADEDLISPYKPMSLEEMKKAYAFMSEEE